MIDKAHLENTVKNYLQTETNFALLIAGKWGAGKTYFFENSIVPLAKTIKPEGLPLEYLPVRVSLFGINSIKDLEVEIIASIYPFLKDSTLKAGFGVLKALTKGVVKNKLGIDLDDFIPKDITVDKSSVINKEHLLLCFDDLERKGKELGAGQVVGYINSLVENHGSKVIILTNEDKLDSDDYKAFKEKTIGISIVFEQDLNTIYDDFIRDKYSEYNDKYYSFLLNFRFDILGLLSNANSNLRIIFDCIKRFELVFNAISNFANSRRDDALQSALRFALGLNIEFKLNLLPKDSFKELSNSSLQIATFDLKVLGNMAKAEQERSKSYVEEFVAKYYVTSSDYNFYTSLYEYIIYYNSLDENKLLAEVNELFPDIRQLPDYIVAYRNVANDYADISEAEYLKSIEDVVRYASEGRYRFIDTVSIFYFVTRFDNPAGIDLNSLVGLIVKGFNAHYEHHQYNSILGYQLEISKDHPHYKEMVEIVEEAIKLNDKKLQDNLSQSSSNLKEILFQNPQKFFENIKSEKNYHENIFISFSPDEIVDVFINVFTYRQRVILSDFIKSKYNGLNADSLSSDYRFLSDLLIKVEGISDEGLTFTQKPAIKELVEVLKRTKRSFEANTFSEPS